MTTPKREQLGMLVREIWIAWAKEQPAAKASWLVPWEGLSEPDREVDRRIGEALYTAGVREGLEMAARECRSEADRYAKASAEYERDAMTVPALRTATRAVAASDLERRIRALAPKEDGDG